MPSDIYSSSASYDVRRSLLEFDLDGTGNVVQLLELTLCLRNFLLAQLNYDGRVNGGFTSYGLIVIYNINFQILIANHAEIDSSEDGIDSSEDGINSGEDGIYSIYPTSTANTVDIYSIP